MTSIFEGQPPKTRPFPFKTRVIWVLGIYIYVYIYIHIRIYIYIYVYIYIYIRIYIYIYLYIYIHRIESSSVCINPSAATFENFLGRWPHQTASASSTSRKVSVLLPEAVYLDDVCFFFR